MWTVRSGWSIPTCGCTMPSGVRWGLQVILMDHVDWMIDAECKDTKYAEDLASALAQQVPPPPPPGGPSGTPPTTSGISCPCKL